MSKILPKRQAEISRKTAETNIFVSLNLDGSGESSIETGIGFFNHMLDAFARHSRIDMVIKVDGDLDIDDHHTIEDVGITLGDAFTIAIGDKRGIERFGSALVPLDEALCESVVDISGRPFLVWNVIFYREFIGDMSTEMIEEFFRAFVMSAKVTAHIKTKAGKNAHHIAESVFKSFARAIKMAVKYDERNKYDIPSTKGVL